MVVSEWLALLQLTTLVVVIGWIFCARTANDLAIMIEITQIYLSVTNVHFLGTLHLNVLQRHRAKIAKDLVMWLVSATMFLFAMYVGGWATWLEIVKTASHPMTQGCATTATDQAILLPRAPMTRHATIVKRRGPSGPRLLPLCNICNISGHFARQCVPQERHAS